MFILLIGIKLHIGMLAYNSSVGKHSSIIAKAVVHEDVPTLDRYYEEYKAEQDIYMKATFFMNYVIIIFILLIFGLLLISK